MIAILNYGVGNIASIQNMFRKIRVPSIITSSVAEVSQANKLILPGVGSFDHCMRQFRSSSFFSTVERLVLNDHKPILGICVGCQMLMSRSEEGKEKGLGWLKGEVVRFNTKRSAERLTIPHMSWSEVSVKNDSPLYAELQNPRFYFVHSYHLTCKNEADVNATCFYGYHFPVSVHRNNIYGVQFHPEKSHKFGMQLLKNFATL